jgi:integrase
MSIKVRWLEKHQHLEYHIRTTYPDGKPCEERRKNPLHSNNRNELERWAVNREKELQRKWLEQRQEEFKPPTMAEAYADYMQRSEARGNEDSTLEWKREMYAHIVAHFGEDIRLDEIKDKHVEEFTKKLGATMKSKSVNNVLDVFLGIMRLAYRRNRIVKLPMVEKRKVNEGIPKHLDLEAFDKYQEAAIELEKEGIWQPLAIGELGAGSGLRRGEMLALHQKSIDFEGMRVKVEFSWFKGKTGEGARIVPTKGKRFRVAGLTELGAYVLKKHRHLRGPLVFYHQRRGWPVVPATPKVMYNWFDLACARARLSPAGKLHVLRHTFGTHQADAGTDAYRLQALMGHSDIRTTQVYVRIAAKAALEATEKLEAYRKAAKEAAKARSKGGGNGEATG